MDINKNAIKEKALDVLEEGGIYAPVVDAVAIAKRNGIDVKEIDMPDGYVGVAGFYNEKKKTIYLAKSDSPVRKLFTVAHELGHIFLGHKNFSLLFRIPREDASYSQVEKEANIFAADLLMPEFMLREYLAKYDFGRSDYKRMSAIFGVPMQAMRHELEHLKPL